MEKVLRYQGVRKRDDDPDPWRTTIHPGTVRRVLAYFRPHIRMVALFVVVATMEALTVAATPLLLRELVDNGIVKNDRGVVILTACLAVGLAVLGAGLSLVSAYISGGSGRWSATTSGFRRSTTSGGCRSRSSPAPRRGCWSAGCTPN
ncbi:hypothetical protein GCM10009647_085650 [Streptomyces sanglieri]|uniref:ABC transmembrane type-1 domain-containing protein n=1 Tax=Streptomyces sanglieri TaxID=193460 RepID=A0ABW2X7S3_9ACTN